MNRLRRIVSLGILCLIFPSMGCAGFLDDLLAPPLPPNKNRHRPKTARPKNPRSHSRPGRSLRSEKEKIDLLKKASALSKPSSLSARKKKSSWEKPWPSKHSAALAGNFPIKPGTGISIWSGKPSSKCLTGQPSTFTSLFSTARNKMPSRHQGLYLHYGWALEVLEQRSRTGRGASARGGPCNETTHAGNHPARSGPGKRVRIHAGGHEERPQNVFQRHRPNDGRLIYQRPRSRKGIRGRCRGH